MNIYNNVISYNYADLQVIICYWRASILPNEHTFALWNRLATTYVFTGCLPIIGGVNPTNRLR